MKWQIARDGAALGLQKLNPAELIRIYEPTVIIHLENSARGLAVTERHPSLRIALTLQKLCEDSRPMTDSRRGMEVELKYFSKVVWRR